MKKHTRNNKMSIVERLHKNNISSFWHFTDISNLASIDKNGILTLENILENNLDVCFGADSDSHLLDRQLGLDKYVHLAFVSDHPMYYVAKRRGSIKIGAWIEIDLSILIDNKAYFSPEVANKSGAKIYEMNLVDAIIEFDKMHSKNFDVYKDARKAEIIVKNNINTKYILGVFYGK
jgi:hypothetical protein